MDKRKDTAKTEISRIGKIIAKHQDEQWPLIPLLQDIQQEVGYIPPESIEPIARSTGLSPAQVQGVLTFYEQFHTEPRGKNVMRVCRGTACHVRGGGSILKIARQDLDIEENETTEDLQFTLETVPCLGTCFLAPAMMINNDYFGKLTPPKLRSIIQRYGESGR